ncbi:MAG TPA: EamA family transporter [Firmicutes bacterium]|nr:EamA family transporter [Bacillota bacterium]
MATTAHASNTANVSNTKGYYIALLCSVILSTTGVFIRYLTEHYNMPPLAIAFWRDAFTAIVVLAALLLIRPALIRVRRADLLFLSAFGLVLALFNILWTVSVWYNGASVATALVYSSAVFTVLLGCLFLKERFYFAKLLAVILCLSGCFLVSGTIGGSPWNSGAAGISIGLLSGLSYAGYSLMGRLASRRGINPWSTLLYTFLFASVALLLIILLRSCFPGANAPVAELFWLGNALPGWGVLFLLAAGPTVLGFGLYNVSLVHLSSGIVNLIATSEPAFTIIIAFFILGEKMTFVQLCGCALILCGVAFLKIYEMIHAAQQNGYFSKRARPTKTAARTKSNIL